MIPSLSHSLYSLCIFHLSTSFLIFAFCLCSLFVYFSVFAQDESVAGFEPTSQQMMGKLPVPLTLRYNNIIFLFIFIFVWIILCTHYLIGAIFLKIWIPSLRSSQTCILLFLISLSLWVLFIFSLRLFLHPLAIAFFSSRSSYCLTTFTLNLFLLYPIPFLLNFLSLSIRFHLFRSLYSPSSPTRPYPLSLSLLRRVKRVRYFGSRISFRISRAQVSSVQTSLIPIWRRFVKSIYFRKFISAQTSFTCVSSSNLFHTKQQK